MNHYISAQITNMTSMARTFIMSCEMAAKEDDGQISKEEAKTLKKITNATERFIKELDSLK